MRYLFFLLLFPSFCFSQVVVSPGEQVIIKAGSCPPPVIDTVKIKEMVVIHDTIFQCPPTIPPPVIVSPPSTGTRQNLLFEAGFDGTKPFLTENELYKQACCTYSVTQSKTIVRSGDGSFWALVKGSDASSSSGYRAEFITKASYNTDAWYGYSTYFENWSACSGCGEHVIQWHPAEGSGSANLGIYTEKNTFRVGLNADGDLTAEKTLAESMKIIPNKWYDFVWHVKWSATAGRIELWIDGVKYVDYTGATLTKGGTPYFKLGINRWNISGVTRSLYYDNLRIGNAQATYKDVAP